MKFIDEFRDKDLAQGLIRRIFEVSTRPSKSSDWQLKRGRLLSKFSTLVRFVNKATPRP